MNLACDILPHPDGGDLAEAAVKRGQRLACAVRDDGAWEVNRITGDLSRVELVALAVALAAMVPLDRTASDLLAWVDKPALPEGQRFPELRWTEEAMRMAHADWRRGKRDTWTRDGNRAYEAARGRRRRAEAKKAAA